MARETPASVAAVADLAPGAGTIASAGWHRVWQQLRRDAAARTALVVLVCIILAAVLAPLVAPYDPTRQFDPVLLRTQPPSAAHWFGTDPASRDVLSRVLHGGRVSLLVAFLAAFLAIAVGATWGAAAGLSGGMVDAILMRTVDACVSVPRVLLLVAVIAMWGSLDTGALVAVIGLTGWFGVSRLVRAEVLALQGRDFVAAARALGAGRRRVIVRHLMPQVVSPLLVAITLGVGNVIVVEAGLSFLGLGVPEPQASWGSIIRDGREVIATAWWLSVFPGLALVLTVLSLNVLADRLRTALNPRHLHAP